MESCERNEDVKESILPGHEQQSTDIICSSCGRFVGALTRCPHCGAHVSKRISVRATRYAAVFLSFVGLLLLYWMATASKIPTVKIGEIAPTMNFAYVRIDGRVVGEPRVFKEGGRVRSLRFTVDDGTGEIPVSAYQTQARELIELDMLPHSGDQIAVAGSLSVAADDRLLLRIQVPDQVTLTRTEAIRVPINQLNPESGVVLINGTISKVSAPKPGKKQPWSVLVFDETGSVPLSFWEDVYSEIQAKDRLIPGQPIQLRSTVNMYQGKIQLTLSSAEDLTFTDSPTNSSAIHLKIQEPGTVTIEEITPDLKGQVIETEGRIIDFRESKNPAKVPSQLVLEDGTSTVMVIFWDKVTQQLGDKKPEIGSHMQVRGVVDAFKGSAQIKVNYADQMEFFQIPPETINAPPPITPIGLIGEAVEGTVMTISGRLGNPRSVRSGVAYPVKDKTGSIQILLWDKNVPGEYRNSLVTGKTVTVTGTVKLYKGELEIIPDSSQAIRIQ